MLSQKVNVIKLFNEYDGLAGAIKRLFRLILVSAGVWINRKQFYTFFQIKPHFIRSEETRHFQSLHLSDCIRRCQILSLSSLRIAT